MLESKEKQVHAIMGCLDHEIRTFCKNAGLDSLSGLSLSLIDKLQYLFCLIFYIPLFLNITFNHLSEANLHPEYQEPNHPISPYPIYVRNQTNFVQVHAILCRAVLFAVPPSSHPK